MKCKIKTEYIKLHLKVLDKIITKKPTLNQEENIFIESIGNEYIKISSFTTSFKYEAKIEANVIKTGSFIINYRKLVLLLKNCKTPVINIYAADNRIVINNFVFEIQNELELLEEVKLKNNLNLKSLTYSNRVLEGLKKITYAASTDPERYFLMSILFHIKSDSLNLVATDEKRLAINYIKNVVQENDELKMIIPINIIFGMMELFSFEHGLIQYHLDDENNATFQFNDTKIVLYKIEYSYPNYDTVIPSNNDKYLETESYLFQNKIKTLNSIKDDKEKRIILSFHSNTLFINKKNLDGETATVKMRVNLFHKEDFNDFIICANKKYIEDILKHLKGIITISFENEKQPVVLQDNDTSVKHVLMPMKMIEDENYLDYIKMSQNENQELLA